MWSRKDRRGRLLAAFCLTLLALTLPAALAAQEEVEESPAVSVEDPSRAPGDDLAARLESEFRILRLRSGLVLEPRSEIAEVETIELTDGGFAVNGDAVTEDELADLLGESAESVLELAAMAEAERAELLEALETGAMVRSTPEPPTPPEAPTRPRRPRRPSRSDDAEVVFGSDLTVGPDEVTRDVVVFGGDLRIEGEVRGDAVAFGGDAWVSGEVDGDFAIVGGIAYLEPGAVIGGDVVNVGGQVEIDEDAEVRGRVNDVPFSPSFRFGFRPDRALRDAARHAGRNWMDFHPLGRAVELVWSIFGLMVLVLFSCLAVVMARGPVDRIGRRIAAEPWKAGLVGLLGQILFVPLLVLVILVLLISIVGIPLLLLVPFAVLALLLVAFLGFVAVALQVGAWLRGRFSWQLESIFWVLLVGLGAIQVWSFFGDALHAAGGPLTLFAVVFLLFGAVVKYVAWTVGFGGALLTRFGTSDAWERRAAVPPPPAPSAPVAETSYWEEEGYGETLDSGLEEPQEPHEPGDDTEPPAEPRG